MHTFTSQLKASQTKVLKNIKDINQRRLKFLELTAAFYNETNRAVVQTAGSTFCVYSSSKNSPGCAIGRWVRKNSKLDFDIVSPVHDPDVFNFLPIWMKKMGSEFLRDVQSLHDIDLNWNKKGLNRSRGEEEYKRIKVRISNEKYVS